MLIKIALYRIIAYIERLIVLLNRTDIQDQIDKYPKNKDKITFINGERYGF